MTEQLMSYLQDGGGILLQIAALVGLYLLRRAYVYVQGYVDSRSTTEKRTLLAQLGKEAFAYAETVHRDYDGPAKLNEAVKYLLERCEGSGLGEVSMKDMRAVIESAWLEDRRQAGLPLDTAPTYSSEQR